MNNPDATFATSRVLPFSPEEIYDAFKDPAKLARWWGPEGFTNTFETFEFKENGKWKFVMHGPNGADFPNENVFRETSVERIVVEHVVGHHFVLTVGFVPTDGGTLVTWDQEFNTVEEADKIRAIVIPANEQNLDRLTATLADQA